MSNLYVNDVRIFRPWEVTKLIDNIPKDENRCKFEVLLYTGGRYTEIQSLYDNPKWFNGVSIQMPNTKHLVKKKQKTRNIRLNPKGQRAVNEYLYRCETGLPHYTNWYRDLKRWCRYAEIGDDNVGITSTRKTWVSWLVSKYDTKTIYIFTSMGHTINTSINHYLNLGFTEDDLSQMDTYVSGWI